MITAHWPESQDERVSYVTWLRDAYARLAVDAQQWFADESSPLHDSIRDFASRAQSLGTTTSPDEIQTFVLRYNQLRSSLVADGNANRADDTATTEQSAVRSAPLIDAAVPWVTTSSPAPSESLAGTSWGAAIAQARRIYPADDATRDAVEHWAEEYRAGAAEHASDQPWKNRYGRLLAFVRGRMRNDDSSSLGTTPPTTPMPADAGGLRPGERTPARTPARSSGGGGAIFLLVAIALGARRKSRRA